MLHQPRNESRPEASRNHGALSQTPLNECLAANAILIRGESPEEFQALLTSHISELQPQSQHEMIRIQQMVIAKWQKMRMSALTAAIQSQQKERQAARMPAESSKTAAAIDKYSRYAARFERQYRRSRNVLLSMREKSRE